MASIFVRMIRWVKSLDDKEREIGSFEKDIKEEKLHN